MARIAVDMDGVLADFIGAAIEIVQRLFPGHPTNSMEKWTDWSGGLSRSEEKALWKEIAATSNFWLKLNAHHNNVGDMARWLITQKDHDIWFCTARSDMAGMTAAKQTQVWLDLAGIRQMHNFMAVVTVRKSEEKWRFYEAAEIGWSIDDKPETVMECGLIQTFKHEAFLLTRPWNEKFGWYNRVARVGEFLRRVK